MSDRQLSGKLTIAAGDFDKEKSYWLEQLSGDLQRSIFPYDYPQPAAPGDASHKEPATPGQLKLEFDADISAQLLKIARNSYHLLHMILVVGLKALLHKYTGNSDILLGVPIYKQEEDKNYLNTVLPLRICMEEGMTFKQLLVAVKQTMVAAETNQNYPVESLLPHLNMTFNDGEDFPLFDVAVLLENIHRKKHIQHTRPNLLFFFAGTGGKVTVNLEYNRTRYDRETVERLFHHLERILGEAVSNAGTPLMELDILDDGEKRRLLVEFNDTRREYPSTSTIDALFREQVTAAPQQKALTYEGKPVTYGELDTESTQLADYLLSLGVVPGEPVAVMVNHSYKVIVSILGILKAGAAYVPLNPDYPEERKRYIIADCGTIRLITDYRGTCDYITEVIHPEDPAIYKGTDKSTAPPVETIRQAGQPGEDGREPAYIMYTSGSTGT
ncbi:MAG: AMP-binding protein, partial [bacterium]|nr:AMP-binding protein [bacterium]